MLSRGTHAAGVAVVVGTATFSAAYGEGLQVAAAYLLAAALGVTVYRQETAMATASAWGSLFVGSLAGAFANLAIGVVVTRWFLAVPMGLLVWQLGVFTWDSWLGVVGVALITAFLAGIVGTLD